VSEWLLAQTSCGCVGAKFGRQRERDAADSFGVYGTWISAREMDQLWYGEIRKIVCGDLFSFLLAYFLLLFPCVQLQVGVVVAGRCGILLVYSAARAMRESGR